MRMGRAAIFLGLALGIGAAPLAASGQQAAVAVLPQHIETTQIFLKTWGQQRWDELRTVTSDTVTLRIGPSTFSLEPAAPRSDVRLTLPFRGLSTVRTDGKITGVTVDEMVFRVGDQELRGPGTIDLVEEHGMFRVTGVRAGAH